MAELYEMMGESKEERKVSGPRRTDVQIVARMILGMSYVHRNSGDDGSAVRCRLPIDVYDTVCRGG